MSVRKIADEMIYGRIMSLMECSFCGNQWYGRLDCPTCSDSVDWMDDDPVAWGCPEDLESQ